MKKILLGLLSTSILSACGSEMPKADAGTLVDAGNGFAFQLFSPPDTNAKPGAFLVTISGESAATDGLAFPPASPGDLAFVDGWEVKFEQVIATLDSVAVSENPDLNPNDQSQTGSLVAEAKGPWAVDLAKAGPLDSKENNGKSWALTRLMNQNNKTGTPSFSTTAKYAFGFDLVKAASGAINVNLDEAGKTSYKSMAAQGYSLWLKGTATFKGTNCRSTVVGYDFNRVPKVVNFSFGMKIPTTYKNCLNPDLQPADSRGVQAQASAETVAQVTLHLDHTFWEALEEDAPLRFDSFAARQSVAMGPAPLASLTEMAISGIDFQAMKDAQNTPIPWRTCGAITATERTTGTVNYRPGSTPVNASGGKLGLKDWYDYVQYNTSNFGHLNNDGLCFPARNFDAPF